MSRMRGGEAGRLTRAERPGAARSLASHVDLRPDPFEDLAAPPLRIVAAAPPAPTQPVADAPEQPSARHDDDAAELVDAATESAETGTRHADVAAYDERPVDRTEAAASPRFAAVGVGVGRPDLVDRSRRRGGAARDIAGAVALGIAIATAIVVLALVFRPTPAATAPMASAVALGSGPVPADVARPAGDATPAAEAAVRLRLGPTAAAERQAALWAAVEAAGYPAPEIREMPFPVERSRIEFFHAADRATAQALSRGLARETGGPIDVRDLSVEDASLEPGRLEVWIAD